MPPSPEPHSDWHGRQRGGGGYSQPAWLVWLQLSLTTMLLVLFVVLVAQSRGQNRSMQNLQQRLQSLENSRALERTAALEQQLRAMLTRLQTLERQEAELAAARQRQRDLEEQLHQQQALLRRPPRQAPLLEETPREVPAPPPPAAPISP